MTYSIALNEGMNNKLFNHLIRKDGQEDLCFALYQKGSGNNRVVGLISEVILPMAEERNVHGNVSFNPEFFDRVTRIARREQKGIVFIHSHPSSGWQRLSSDDRKAESMLAPRVKAITGEPLIGMTLGLDGAWSARFWNKANPKTYQCDWCESVRVVGKRLTVTFNDEIKRIPEFKDEFTRTISAWGEEKQANLARLKVGIVGVGSVGSQIAECLLRTGIQDIILIDFDLVERKNLDRLHGLTRKDIGRLKSEVYAHQLNDYKLYPSQNAVSIPYSIIEEYGFNSAVDCDVIFCCVDRPWPRFILNCISFAYHIPVIDGGIDASFSPKKRNLDQSRWRTFTVNSERRCMKCMEQYRPEDVSLEQSGMLEDQNYIKGLPEDHFSKKGENVYAFSLGLAGLEIQQFLSLVLYPKGVSFGPKEMDFVTGNIDQQFKFQCEPDCEFQEFVAAGDSIKKALVQRHEIAEVSRKKAIIPENSESLKKGLIHQLRKGIRRIFNIQ